MDSCVGNAWGANRHGIPLEDLHPAHYSIIREFSGGMVEKSSLDGDLALHLRYFLMIFLHLC